MNYKNVQFVVSGNWELGMLIWKAKNQNPHTTNETQNTDNDADNNENPTDKHIYHGT